MQFCYNKSQQGYITPDQFNNLAPICQMSLINDRIGNVKKYRPGYPVPAVGFGITQKSREELRPLLKPPTVTAAPSAIMPVPTDYLYYDTVSIGGRQAQECTEDEILELNSSLIKPPTLLYPKFVMHSNGFNFYPTTITTVNLSYLRKPVTPVWNYTLVNDTPVYAATGGIVGDGISHDFEVSETAHFEICAKILQAVGLNLSLGEIVQWSEMAEQQGK